MIKARIVPVVLFSLLAVMFITVTAPTASADSFNLNILNCNCQPTGTNAGTVVLTAVGGSTTQVDFVVTLNAPLNFHDTNAFDAFAFNYSGAGTLSASLVTTNFAFSNVATGSGSMDGAGHDFEFFLDYTGPSLPGGNTGVTVLSFRITSSVAVTLSQFEFLNGNSADFAASVSATTASGCTGVVSGGNGTSQSTPSGGSAAGGACGGTVTTPEPASNLTLGLGLLILGFASRRFIKKASQEG